MPESASLESASLESAAAAALVALEELAAPRPPEGLFYSAPGADRPSLVASGRIGTAHVSNCMELVFARRGELTVVTSRQAFVLLPGQLLVIDTGVEHGEQWGEGSEIVFFLLHETNVEVDQYPASADREAPLYLIGRSDLTLTADALREELAAREWGFARAVHGVLEYLSCLLARRIQRASYVRTPWIFEGDYDQTWQAAKQVLGHLAAHYPEQVDLEALAKSAGYSYSHLNRFFVAHLGKTMSKCLRDFRIARARNLLAHTGLSISEIAQLVGYSDASALRRGFRSATGRRLTRSHGARE